ncbi:helix-turn-helix domain-containing protein [Streptomyces scopuliridis]|uniref:Helix-turn-helix domain-containing protein n=1 Tax=Streptomyces scopuliridis TaxID=452529 RepID=A0ACD4ZDQ5_9ACTN|nr:helix-turn-helix domain-containing protein [Streptomyces scopuliridis]WSB96289.1 helix-turn-helix domain-containing protein [Streptomyces scopuliridis]WSC10006.1 helix-turn-helix domain-containing protein [Streptomyces scopuliridis]
MKELAGKLAALDPDAGAALQVIAYFDRLVEGRAGLESLVRGAAVLSGCPARLVDDGRGVRIRVDADGVRQDHAGPVLSSWMSAPLVPGGAPAVWLESAGPPDGVHAMVLERTAAAARVVLDRTRGRAPLAGPAADPASVEVLLDASAPEHARWRAAGRLGLRNVALARVVAPAGDVPVIEAVRVRDARPPLSAGRRAGVGPAVPVLELPASAAAARTALRFTAEGTDQDPGPRTVYADELGGLALLAGSVGPDTEPIPDVRALDRAVAAAPWAAGTLHTVAYATSLRAAAAELNMHHSTLQDRLAQAEHWLGWPVHDPRGRLRLQLALALWRLHRNLHL